MLLMNHRMTGVSLAVLGSGWEPDRGAGSGSHCGGNEVAPSGVLTEVTNIQISGPTKTRVRMARVTATRALPIGAAFRPPRPAPEVGAASVVPRRAATVVLMTRPDRGRPGS